jgi:hypothetical protein
MIERKAHAPLEAGWAGPLGDRVQISKNRRKHSRFQWLHDAICSASGSSSEYYNSGLYNVMKAEIAGIIRKR